SRPRATPQRPRRLTGCSAAAASPAPKERHSVVAVDPLAPLVAFLRLEREGRDRSRLQSPQGDRLPGLLTIAVGAVIDACERLVDLGDQLALTVTRPQFDGPIGF